MRNGGFKIKRFLLSSFGIGLKGNIFYILNLFSCFIIALFFRHRFSRVLKFIDLYLSRQACKVGGGGGSGGG